jgi:hypothetical protein
MKRITIFLLSLLCGLSAMSKTAAQSFHPDVIYRGDTLRGWSPKGDAQWKPEGGNIVGRGGENGGWLLSEHAYQDVAFYGEFRCEGSCEAGLLLRAEPTSDGGLKGFLVSFHESSLPAYAVTIDHEGKITHREVLARGGLLQRVTPPPAKPQTPGAARPRNAASIALPFSPPDTSLKVGDWNRIESFFDTNTIRSFLNDGHQEGAIAAEGYGRIALYVGGKTQVNFRKLAVADLNRKVRDEEKIGTGFRKQKISDFYYSWGTAAADFNHDGVLDVVSGPYIYYGPDYRTSSEIWLALSSNPTTEFATDSTMEFSADFNGDGWPDVLTVMFGGGPGVQLYLNPKGENRRWDKYTVGSSVQSEIALLRDVDGDGKPELVYSGDGYVRYLKPDSADPTKPWGVHNISEKGYGASHGIGVGDINGDGRMDILDPFGWWEQPSQGSANASWIYHPQAFARYGRGMMGGSVMAVYDVNGDGLNDVVTSLNAHGWGLAWYEQKRDHGSISFVEHMVMDDFTTTNSGDVTFSELHGSSYADLDGDGVMDFVVGKRYFSHLDTNLDPDPRDAPVLYWYKTVRDPKTPGGARLLPQLIDTHSGVGSDVLAVDLNGDGAIDIVTSTRFGTDIYWNTAHKTPQHAKGLPAPTKLRKE